MKIAIIGSGISGLVASWQATQSGHQVTLFERRSALGMDAHSIDINLDGSTVRGDVPSRMFSEKLWPQLFQLYREIGVEFEPVNPAQSIADVRGNSYLNFEAGNRPDVRLMQIVKPRVRKIAADLKRFFERVPSDVASGLPESLTFERYLSDNRYSDEFVFEFLFPSVASTVCTCSYSALRNYPATVLLRALEKMALQGPLLRASLGARDVVRRLVSDIQDVRLGCSVEQVSNADNGVDVRFRHDQGAGHESFDVVAFATQANHVTNLLEPPTDEERDCLNGFCYEDVEVVVHQDSSRMPNREKDWATFNMRADGDRGGECTVWMNPFHRQWDTQANVFQTICPLEPVNDDDPLVVAKLQRPIVDASSFGRWKQLQRINQQPGRRIFFCGSYATPGIPLLETGVVSAMQFTEQLEKRTSVTR